MSCFDRKSVLITGASGLVGLHIASVMQYLIKSGMSIDLYLVTKNGFAHYMDQSVGKSIVLTGDLTDYAFCKSLPACDFIVHAAGYGQPIKFMEDPIKTILLNTNTTCMLFEKIKTNGKFLFISSSEIYEGSPNIPYKEDDIGQTNTNHARSCYIDSNRCGESICYQYIKNGYCVKIARLSLAYGPGTRQDDTRAINSFIRKGFSGRIELLDDGKSFRTYCYIADAIEIMLNILINGKDAIYNVGGKSRTTIADLAKLIGGIMDAAVFIPETAQFLHGAPHDVMLDLTKVETEFNKTSFISLEKGLSNTIEWQRQAFYL